MTPNECRDVAVIREILAEHCDWSCTDAPDYANLLLFFFLCIQKHTRLSVCVSPLAENIWPFVQKWIKWLSNVHFGSGDVFILNISVQKHFFPHPLFRLNSERKSLSILTKIRWFHSSNFLTQINRVYYKKNDVQNVSIIIQRINMRNAIRKGSEVSTMHKKGMDRVFFLESKAFEYRKEDLFTNWKRNNEKNW